MNIKPLNDRLVVRRHSAETMTSFGMVIPDCATEKPSQGEVVAVGPGRTLDDGTLRQMTVCVGDTVLFGKYSGQEFKLDGNELLTMREDDVIGIVNR